MVRAQLPQCVDVARLRHAGREAEAALDARQQRGPVVPEPGGLRGGSRRGRWGVIETQLIGLL